MSLGHCATQVCVSLSPNREGTIGHTSTQYLVEKSLNCLGEVKHVNVHMRLIGYAYRPADIGQIRTQRLVVSSLNVSYIYRHED